MSAEAIDFAEVSRRAAPGDNVAIAFRTLVPGTRLRMDGSEIALRNTVLEGHRFAVSPIAPGEPLVSWGYPFATASTRISPGDYVCNQSMLDSLKVRRLDQHLPERANFTDLPGGFVFDERTFRPAPPVPRVANPRFFEGYARGGGRGVGTRNLVVILGTSSRTAAFSRQLAARLQPLAAEFPDLDGVVAVAHTEGGGTGEPHNVKEVLRVLAGFIVHPNVGAVLAVDEGGEPIDNARLRAFMLAKEYPLADVPHRFLSVQGNFAVALAEGESVVRQFAATAAAAKRSRQPLSGLRVALQCGGSDAFSGLSGNPLAGAVVHELIRQGGSAVLTETDESVGSEPYLVQNIADLPTARAMFAKIEAFKERLSWHGVTAESNPSAGNKLRGLYNIVLKSLGAVHKKDPRTRLDYVIDYAEPQRAPGFYFMDGPGNDLEGIAGQVASGCNLILFVTGNGSVTNFPFVPTLKITTTTRRHQLLVHEMDINAGRYLDGEPMAELAAEAFELTVTTASGRRTRGEIAGHSQVGIWRDWPQTSAARLPELLQRPMPAGHPLIASTPQRFPRATERIGLVMPTSMCSAQIARLAADRLNERLQGNSAGIARFVALVHSEGCGYGGETVFDRLQRTYRGYLSHPNVAAALLLEHGCEKLPNDVMRRQLEAAGESVDRIGWASVQLDGGIDRVIEKIEAWFARTVAALPSPAGEVSASCNGLTVGMLAAQSVGGPTAATFAAFASAVLAAGGSILVPEGNALLVRAEFRDALLRGKPMHATLAYGQAMKEPGFHVVATETDHWVENCTGLAGCGCHLLIGAISGAAQPGHPLVPVIQLAEAGVPAATAQADVDARLTGQVESDLKIMNALVADVLAGRRVPVAAVRGLVDFQITRGLLGVTT